MISIEQLMELLPFTGRAVVYMENGEVAGVMPLQKGQIVADLKLMIELLTKMGYEVKRSKVN